MNSSSSSSSLQNEDIFLFVPNDLTSKNHVSSLLYENPDFALIRDPGRRMITNTAERQEHKDEHEKQNIPYKPLKPAKKELINTDIVKRGVPANLPSHLPKVVGRFEKCIKNHEDFFESHSYLSKNERYLQNAELYITIKGIVKRKEKIKILEKQKLLSSDEDAQDEYFWISLHGAKPKDFGYLHDDEVVYIAQEISEGFLLFYREVLKDFIYEQLPPGGFTTDKPKDALYNIFKIGRRREMKTLIARKDLEEKGFVIKKILYFDDDQKWGKSSEITVPRELPLD